MNNKAPRFQVLDGLPPYGPAAQAFSATGQGAHREGFVVRFFTNEGKSWVGNFQVGLSSLCTVEEHPDGHRFVVISGGQGYIINPNDRTSVEVIGAWYSCAMHADGLLILVTPIDIEAIGPTGRIWRTKRISWDGLRNLKIDRAAHTITGEAWTWADDRWIPFDVELSSGTIKGGAYNGPD